MIVELAERIERETLSSYGLNKRVVLFNTQDARAAAETVSEFVKLTLAAEIVEILLVRIANAGAFGFQMSDGRKVFLKVHAGELEPEELQAVHNAQELLREKGCPVPKLLMPSMNFPSGRQASIHAFRDRGELLKASDPGCVEATGRGLASLIRIAESLPAMQAIPDYLSERREPLKIRAEQVPAQAKLPAASRARSEWQTVVSFFKDMSERTVVGHSDWALRNLRFSNGNVSSIFDFEALQRGPEPYFVGLAAVRLANQRAGVTNPANFAARFVKAYEREAKITIKGKFAAEMDTAMAATVARFCYDSVRSNNMTDEEAPRILRIFMRKFRAEFDRNYTPQVAV